MEYITGIKFLQRYVNDLAQALKQTQDTAPESGWSEFLASELTSLVDKVNDDERTVSKWDIMYSLTGKVPIGIVRKPIETPA